jgi:hypothetical protein
VKPHGKEEEIIIPSIIPRLLSEETIQQIRTKCEARRTWQHGAIKFQCLFSRMIFDAETKSRKNGSQDNIALTGTANACNKRYYRPFRGADEDYPYKRYMINADLLENAILDALFGALSENRALYKAVFNETENQLNENFSKEREQAERELKIVDKRLSSVESVLLAYEKEDVLTFFQRMRGKIAELEKRRSELKDRLVTLDYALKNIPTKQEVRSKREWIREQLTRRMEQIYFRSGLTFRDLAFRDKRSLVNILFGGRDELGRRYGTYVFPVDSTERPKRYRFEAYGRLGTISGWLDNRTDDYQSYNEVEDTHDEEDTEFKVTELLRNGEKLHLDSERHAYNGLCLHQR